MKLLKIIFAFSTVFLVFSPVAVARDFDWIRELNITAESDPSGFRAMLGTRFKIGEVEINALISNFEKPADAYMVLRLGEMSGHPTDYVLERYSTHKGNGWGALAQSLGIKPGSTEFHALKNGHDLCENKDRGESKAKGKIKQKDKCKKNK